MKLLKNWDNKTWLASLSYITSFNNFLLKKKKLNKDSQILDIGCGSGISGNALARAGHCWVGTDISRAMLKVANDRDTEGDVIHSDMGHGFGFRPGTFDGAISISAL